ncbi:serpin family protein [Neolewinella antarctica]|uniref:Serine protease inhibitor n=1 Tax=Neolewinella antarctica TaxID=442734 RepID=A0ABX0XG21_9BACT|nr:serpin family protein [Neolewinella antarctica]NJC28186.1 serine protease inhibitor [Neolewinella antarctica]
MTLQDLLSATKTGIYSPASLHILLKVLFGAPLTDADRKLHRGILREKQLHLSDNELHSRIDSATGIWQVGSGTGSTNGLDADVIDFHEVPVIDLASVNEWVKQHTRNLIDNVGLDSTDGLVKLIVNTLYLKAYWQLPFDPQQNTVDTFNGRTKSWSRITFMHLGDAYYPAELPISFGPGYKIIRLPYKDEQLVFEVLLPDGDNLRPEDLVAFAEPRDQFTFVDTACTLAFPKFTLDAQLDLNPIKLLRQFPEYIKYAKGMSLGNLVIKQGAKIIVDEKGTEAAAVTGMGATGMPRLHDHLAIFVNRPFVFRIFDVGLGVELFWGVVLDLE